MTMSLQRGEQHSVREFCERAFLEIGIKLDWKGNGVTEIGIATEVQPSALLKNYDRRENFENCVKVRPLSRLIHAISGPQKWIHCWEIPPKPVINWAGSKKFLLIKWSKK